MSAPPVECFTAPMDSPIKLIKTYASFVKLAHTVFALPFALVGMMAAYSVPTGFLYILPGPDGVPPHPGSFDQHVPFSLLALAFILACMVGARSFAMAVNRIIDRRIDASNPRTATRELPAGRMSLAQAWLFASGMAVLYFVSCAALGDVVFLLSPIPILLMALYPLTKRFTWLCHLVLGASLGLAPVGAWVAVRSLSMAYNTDEPFPPEYVMGWGQWFGDAAVQHGLGWSAVAEPLPWLLGGAVMLWVAGFDVIYALQDDEFDRANRLKSIPARFGRRSALWISRAMHVASAALFFAFTWLLLNPAPLRNGMDVTQYTQVAQWVWAAPCVMLAGMIYQHSLVRPDDLRRVNLAFFTVNGAISVAFGAVFAAAWLFA
jgi:4-hydroxybenzoate polyprenyltransferase